MSLFKKATKERSKLRLALIGVSGSGKTYSSLAIATHLGNRVALIDTERGSASKYADQFGFDAMNLDDAFGSFAPENYVKAIKAAEADGYDVIVIDSLSHAWMGKGGALEMHETAVDRQKTKNSYTAWRDVTVEHNALVDALVQCKAHLIVTMRAKTEYVQETDEKGNKSIRKLGLAPVQRDGLEYEFDLVGDMDNAKLVITKSRCPALTNAVIKNPNGQVSDALKRWLSDGAQPAPVQPQQTAQPAQAVQQTPTLVQPQQTAPAPTVQKQEPPTPKVQVAPPSNGNGGNVQSNGSVTTPHKRLFGEGITTFSPVRWDELRPTIVSAITNAESESESSLTDTEREALADSFKANRRQWQTWAQGKGSMPQVPERIADGDKLEEQAASAMNKELAF